MVVELADRELLSLPWRPRVARTPVLARSNFSSRSRHFLLLFLVTDPNTSIAFKFLLIQSSVRLSKNAEDCWVDSTLGLEERARGTYCNIPMVISERRHRSGSRWQGRIFTGSQQL